MISNYFPLMIVVNHFTDSYIICLIAFFVYGAIATFTPLDIPLNILFSIFGCIWVLTDGYYEIVIILYFIIVIPKLIALASYLLSSRK